MENPSGNKLRAALICFALVLGTVGLYWPVGTFDFVGYDDPFYVVNNPHIRGGFTWHGLKWAFCNITSGFTYWHPVTWMSHMLDFQFFGLNAGAQHWMNVVYHIVDVLLLFLVLWQLTSAMWPSAVVAALFAWHPLNVESVAWVTERKNLLSTFFLLLTVWAYARHAKMENGKWKMENTEPPVSHSPFSLLHSPFLLMALLCFALGLMSKPMLVTTPMLLLLLDFWPLNRLTSDKWQVAGSDVQHPRFTLHVSRFTAILAEKIPFFILSAISAVITIQSHKEFQSLASEGQVSFGLRLANAFYSYARYLKKMVWPNDLVAVYPFPSEWPVARIVICVLLFVAITAVAVFTVRKRPFILFGWLWFLVALTPVIGVVQAGAQAMADRFAYVPLIGLFIAIAWSIGSLAGASQQPHEETSNIEPRTPNFELSPINVRATIIFAALVLPACLVASRHQLPYWRDSIALFERSVAIEKQNPIAEYNLGYALATQNRSSEAKAHFIEALRISRNYVDAHNNLAAILLSEGDAAGAISHYEHVLKTDPNHALAHNNLAIVLEKQGKTEEALKHYAAAAKNAPNNPDFQIAFASALSRAGRTTEAVQQIVAAAKSNPDSPEINYNAGNAMMMVQRVPEAVGYFAKAVQLKPNFPDAHYNLGTVLAMSGRVADATPHFAEAAKLKPDFAEAHFSLGMALAESGKKEDSNREFKEALRLANANGNKDLAAQIEARLSH